MKNLKHIKEYYKDIETPQGRWRVKLKEIGKQIDLNDKDSKIKIGTQYSFLGINFTPIYNSTKEEYYTIIQKLNKNDVNDIYTGWVVYSDSLDELKNKIRFKIKEYLEKLENGSLNDNKKFNNLKNYKLFLEYNQKIQNKIDYILDKIANDGIDSLSTEERSFLDAQKNGEVESEQALSKLTDKEDEFSFESSDGRFEFNYSKTIEDTEGYKHYGIIKLPKMITGDGEIIEGDIEGYISEDVIGNINTHFNKKGYTDFDFAEGLEYEYDDFIQEALTQIKYRKQV